MRRLFVLLLLAALSRAQGCRDVLFLVDGSFSVSPRLGHFDLEKQYIRQVIRGAPDAPAFPRFAAITYGGKNPTLAFDFADRTKAQVEALVNTTIKHQRGSTLVAVALNLALQRIRVQNRPGNKLIILMMDWVPNDDTCALTNEMARLNTSLMVIGVDGTYQRTHPRVTCIASPDKSGVPMIYSTTWESLTTTAHVKYAMDALCDQSLLLQTNNPTTFPTMRPTFMCPQHVPTIELGPCRVRRTSSCGRICYNPYRNASCFLLGTPAVNLCTTEKLLDDLTYTESEYIVRQYSVLSNYSCIDAYHKCWDTLCKKSSHRGACGSGCKCRTMVSKPDL